MTRPVSSPISPPPMPPERRSRRMWLITSASRTGKSSTWRTSTTAGPSIRSSIRSWIERSAAFIEIERGKYEHVRLHRHRDRRGGGMRGQSPDRDSRGKGARPGGGTGGDPRPDQRQRRDAVSLVYAAWLQS